ncbi:MAG: hypothetical protein LUE12_04325 [Ruminococcus sp.]|nr:hypothetical protein [Ruminococcus sp.]
METVTFMTSLLTFYLKGEIAHEQNFIRLNVPNTILTFIPLGKHKETIAINQIASVDTDFKLIFKHFLIGLIEVILGFSLFSKSALAGIIFLLLGIGTIINSFQTLLIINTTSGNTKGASFLIFEKSKAEKCAEQINMLISQRLDDTNTRVHTENQTNEIVNAIHSIK